LNWRMYVRRLRTTSTTVERADSTADDLKVGHERDFRS
jgi:hypothetical protein